MFQYFGYHFDNSVEIIFQQIIRGVFIPKHKVFKFRSGMILKLKSIYTDTVRFFNRLYINLFSQNPYKFTNTKIIPFFE